MRRDLPFMVSMVLFIGLYVYLFVDFYATDAMRVVLGFNALYILAQLALHCARRAYPWQATFLAVFTYAIE